MHQQTPRKAGGASSAGADPATTQPSTAAATSPAEKLHGTWVSVEPVDVAAGGAKVKVTFKEDGPVKIVAWSTLPFVGQVRETSGPYEVHGNTIESEAIHGGTSVKYWFDGDHLVIQYSDAKNVKFRRQ